MRFMLTSSTTRSSSSLIRLRLAGQPHTRVAVFQGGSCTVTHTHTEFVTEKV
jgi:hypothetical protein